MKFLKTGPALIEGHLQFDPELRFTPSGKAVSNFFVRTEDGSMVDCTAWEGTAEQMAEHGLRGKAIKVYGKWAVRHWTDREGLDHTKNYVLTDAFKLG